MSLLQQGLFLLPLVFRVSDLILRGAVDTLKLFQEGVGTLKL